MSHFQDCPTNRDKVFCGTRCCIIKNVKGEEILQKAVEHLKKQTGLSLTFEPAHSKQKLFEYILKIAHSSDENAILSFPLIVKRKLTDASVGETAISANLSEETLALASGYISPSQAERLRRLNIMFLDTAGNAYFNKPGLYVYIAGNKPETPSMKKPVSIFNATGLKLLFHLLTKPDLEKEDYRTIEEETNVPRTSVGRIMNDLERGGFLIRRTAKERFLVRKPELFKRWAESYGEKLRIKLKPKRYYSTKQTGRWWEEIKIKEYQSVWGGETGGAKLTGHLKPQNVTIYADSTLPKLQAKYGLIKDEKGEIEILRKFWQFGETEDSAPPLVVYADLLATADERNLETAEMIYERYLAPLAKEDSR